MVLPPFFTFITHFLQQSCDPQTRHPALWVTPAPNKHTLNSKIVLPFRLLITLMFLERHFWKLLLQHQEVEHSDHDWRGMTFPAQGWLLRLPQGARHWSKSLDRSSLPSFCSPILVFLFIIFSPLCLTQFLFTPIIWILSQQSYPASKMPHSGFLSMCLSQLLTSLDKGQSKKVLHSPSYPFPESCFSSQHSPHSLCSSMNNVGMA